MVLSIFVACICIVTATLQFVDIILCLNFLIFFPFLFAISRAAAQLISRLQFYEIISRVNGGGASFETDVETSWLIRQSQ